VRVAFATCSLVPDGWPDDFEAAALLDADFLSWDDPAADWRRYDRVLLRSVFNYTHRVEDFLAWCSALGAGRMLNRPELVSFNADERYLAQLAAPTVPTTFVCSPADLPELDDEIVVKPNISSGARDTGRFGPRTRADAAALVERITASGRVALVQPYLASVDDHGECACVFIGGELSHVLRKRALLNPDEVAPIATVELGRQLGVAQVMFEDDLVVPGTADAAERALAKQVLAEIGDRFGPGVVLRVDIVRDRDGEPVLLELEAIDPLLYLGYRAGASAALAAAVRSS
jgi:hypothetical protein